MINKLREWYNSLKVHYSQNYYMLGRTACLGQDIFNLKYNNPVQSKSLINMQKVRADVFVDFIKNKNRPKSNLVKPFMAREDIFPMIVEQEKFNWLKPRNTTHTILLDSFSELTDQKFTHINQGWSFCCNYSDINHSPEFESNFVCEGLIPLDELESVYNIFFAELQKNYPVKKIMFVHFPTTLDTRELFIERGKAILQILLSIEKTNKSIHNLYVNDNEVFPYTEDDFPYHYGMDTQLAFVKQWK